MPAIFDGAADEFFVGVRSVDLGGINMGNTQVECPVDRANGFGIAAFADVIVAGH